MSFETLGLGPKTLQAISEVGYEKPTPIQAQTIPHILEGKDVIALAQTGTGKTAAFVLPMFDVLSRGRAKARMPRSLIVEPTRELAIQVAEHFETYGKHHSFSVALLIGGESFGDQERKLSKGVDVLIVTPGRLLDMYDRGKILLNDVKMLVIDEADRMLDMGFIPDIERIASLLPSHQTALFSATMPAPVRGLAQKFLKNPEEITVSSPTQAATHIEQYILRCPEKDKKDALCALLEKEKCSQAIIFCNRKKEVDLVLAFMKKRGLKGGALHGDLSQAVRNETVKAFKEGEISFLVASDIAARGLDIEDLPVVINFHLPMSGEDYIHRIGRTGRAGKLGKAFTFVSASEEKNLDSILKTSTKKIEEYVLSAPQKTKGQGTSKKSAAQTKAPAAEKNPSSSSHKQDVSREEPSNPVLGFGETMPAFMRVRP